MHRNTLRNVLFLNFISVRQTTEGSMAYKTAPVRAPPPAAKPPEPEGGGKESIAAATSGRKSEEFGYMVTNQR